MNLKRSKQLTTHQSKPPPKRRVLKRTPTAADEIRGWKLRSEKKYLKIRKMCEEMQIDPKKGTGKPEPLKHEFTGYWSRRIDRENRLVYTFDDDFIYIIQAKGHYPNPPDESEIVEPDDETSQASK
jgi:toxin YoeB